MGQGVGEALETKVIESQQLPQAPSVGWDPANACVTQKVNEHVVNLPEARAVNTQAQEATLPGAGTTCHCAGEPAFPTHSSLLLFANTFIVSSELLTPSHSHLSRRAPIQHSVLLFLSRRDPPGAACPARALVLSWTWQAWSQ